MSKDREKRKGLFSEEDLEKLLAPRARRGQARARPDEPPAAAEPDSRLPALIDERDEAVKQRDALLKRSEELESRCRRLEVENEQLKNSLESLRAIVKEIRSSLS